MYEGCRGFTAARPVRCWGFRMLPVQEGSLSAPTAWLPPGRDCRGCRHDPAPFHWRAVTSSLPRGWSESIPRAERCIPPRGHSQTSPPPPRTSALPSPCTHRSEDGEGGETNSYRRGRAEGRLPVPRASLEKRGSAVPVGAWQRICAAFCPGSSPSHGGSWGTEPLPGHGAAPGLALIHLPSSDAGLR